MLFGCRIVTQTTWLDCPPFFWHGRHCPMPPRSFSQPSPSFAPWEFSLQMRPLVVIGPYSARDWLGQFHFPYSFVHCSAADSVASSVGLKALKTVVRCLPYEAHAHPPARYRAVNRQQWSIVRTPGGLSSNRTLDGLWRTRATPDQMRLSQQ